MKYVVRPEVWESNSSMSHSCIILPKRLAEEWKENDDMYHYYGEVISYDELVERIIKDKRYSINSVDEIDSELFRELAWDDVCTYQDWISDFGDYCDDVDTTEYTSESGDEIVIHCKYGAHY